MHPMTYKLVSEEFRWIQRPNLRGSASASPPKRAPSGTVHAVAEDSDETLCGQDARSMHEFGQWDQGMILGTNPTTAISRCPGCSDLATE